MPDYLFCLLRYKMWVLFAFLSALFAGDTAILVKIGVKDIDSNIATAIRTIIIVIFTWIMVFVTGSNVSGIDTRSAIFLILSGVTTGLSWLCYFRALQLGDINKVVPIDKSSIVLSILLSFILLGETVTVYKITGMFLIAIGTYSMIEKKESENKKIENNEENKNNDINNKKNWLFYGILSALFAALTSILGKIGIKNVDSNYGTALRTIVVLIMAWLVVLVTKKGKEVQKMNMKTFVFLILSGISTGLSWLCYYRALQDGDVSIVVSIDKLSIVVSVLFSYMVFNEKLSRKSFLGFIGIIAGTFIMLIK